MTRKAVLTVFAILVVVFLTSIYVFRFEIKEYTGIAFWAELGIWGKSDTVYNIYNPDNGKFIQGVSIYNWCKEKNVSCPIHINEYYGHIPENGDHVNLKSYHLGTRWEDDWDLSGITVTKVEKLPDRVYVEPQEVPFSADLTVNLNDSNQQSFDEPEKTFCEKIIGYKCDSLSDWIMVPLTIFLALVSIALVVIAVLVVLSFLIPNHTDDDVEEGVITAMFHDPDDENDWSITIKKGDRSRNIDISEKEFRELRIGDYYKYSG